MTKERGFLEFARHDPEYRPADERIRDFRAVEVPVPDEAIVEQANRCMDCGTPFCHGCGCPLSNVIPEFNDAVYRRRWGAAVDVLQSTNPFPEFTGRICPAPCEGSCVLGINSDPVTIRQIELAASEHGFEMGLIKPMPPCVRMEKSVAVVGSGPAGLAVADSLNRAGFNVTVFENMPKPGGILRYGIPDFKLEKWVVDRRARLMEAEGVKFECGVEVGRDVSHRFLRDRFDSVVLTGGAREPRDIKAPGRELAGIHFAMPFLVQQNLRNDGVSPAAAGAIHAGGLNVVVIGGGDTGADCVGTSIRQGAKSVRQFEILPRPPDKRAPETPWPAWPHMLRTSSSHKEGCERRWCVTTLAFKGEGGRLRRLSCAEVAWKTPQGGGAPVPVNVAGSEFEVDAELVLLAMGFVGPGPNRLVDELGLKKDGRGFVARNADGMTSERGVFVAGDMTQGASLVVRAIADGLRVGRAVAGFLRGRTGR
jgi:glutamate synthase (NADPH/NADH) small chain